jgi:hypothetical protein
MPLTVEQFSEELLTRWKQLHPEYKKPVKQEPLVRSKSLLTYPPDVRPGDVLAVNGDSLVVGKEDKDDVAIDYDKNQGITDAIFKRAKKKLRDPITWIGPIAVGEEKFLRGWWAALLPNSATVIFFFRPFGPQARDRESRNFT